MAEYRIMVEVVFAEAARLWRRSLDVPAGCTAAQAVEAARRAGGLPEDLPEPLRLGVFSRPVAPDYPLREGDRVEIYRPLGLDPMAARRRRAGTA